MVRGKPYTRSTLACWWTSTTDGMFDAMADIRHIDDGTKEWNNVEITFTWEAGEPPLDMGTVTVSYDPVSGDELKDIPRYVSAAPPTM